MVNEKPTRSLSHNYNAGMNDIIHLTGLIDEDRRRGHFTHENSDMLTPKNHGKLREGPQAGL